MRKTRVTKEFHKNFEYRYDKLTAVANTWIFQGFINPTDSVLHFWCGGGYLLNSLVCGEKYGVMPGADAPIVSNSPAIFCNSLELSHFPDRKRGR